MKKYLEVKANDKKVTHVKLETSYSKGGMNYFTYKTEPRGYYLSVSPVERRDRGGYVMESYTSFTGYKYLMKEVKRQSKKAESEAEGMVQDVLNKTGLLDRVLTENGLELADEAAYENVA